MFRSRVALATILCVLGATPVMSSDAVQAPPPTAVSAAENALVNPILGLYVSDRDSSGNVLVASLGQDMITVKRGTSWDGVGFWNGTEFRGVIRSPYWGARALVKTALGTIRFKMTSPQDLEVEIALDGKTSTERWTKADRALRPESSGTPSPRPGEYVQVEELPEVLTRVPLVYPDAARAQGIHGTVLLRVLVGEDGRVRDARVTKSIPLLDDAAVASARQWIFRPALSKGKPVAVWVAVPVLFTLN